MTGQLSEDKKVATSLTLWRRWCFICILPFLILVEVSPYCMSEIGYAGFNLPIEIFFKNKKEPRKIRFNYDLFLQMYKPVSFCRCEKLTFQKPAEECKEKLIKADRVLVLPPVHLCRPPTQTVPPNKQKQSLTSKVTSVKLKEVLSLSSKAHNKINSMNTRQILMLELGYILADEAYDITAAIDVFSRRKSLAKMYPKESKEKSAPSEDELINLAELEKTLMSIKDVSVLQKVVNSILSSGYFENV